MPRPASRTDFGRLGDERPDSGLVQALRGRASRVLLEPEGVPQLLTRLAAQVEKLPRVEAVHSEQAQKKLEDLGRQIQQRLKGLLQARAHVEPIENAQGHEWVLKELLAKASKQVVIVSPSIRYSTLSALLPDLQAVLKRRVRVVFAWGRTISDSIAPEVRTALSELAAKYPGRVLLSAASVRTAACVVIQDNVRAYVSAHGPLDMVSGSGGQVTGLLIEPSKYGPELPGCITDLLLWVRRTGFSRPGAAGGPQARGRIPRGRRRRAGRRGDRGDAAAAGARRLHSRDDADLARELA